MGHDLKYGTVTTERGSIADDEPVFVIRAKDAAAVEAIKSYGHHAAAAGADKATIEGVMDRAWTFLEWQKANAEIVSPPDTVSGQLVEPEGGAR